MPREFSRRLTGSPKRPNAEHRHPSRAALLCDRRYFNMVVDPVEQRTGNLTQIPLNDSWRAAAFPRREGRPKAALLEVRDQKGPKATLTTKRTVRKALECQTDQRGRLKTKGLLGRTPSHPAGW